jgi:catechol 2,3-dioxygenase-like lactoylglutathione lyase family enzyme
VPVLAQITKSRPKEGRDKTRRGTRRPQAFDEPRLAESPTGPLHWGMAFNPPPLIPELDVSDLEGSLAVYVDVLGFRCHVSRPEDRFVYLIRERVHLMLEEAHGPGRRFGSASLEFPFGRGINLQIEVTDVEALYAKVQRSGLAIPIGLEDRWYRQGQEEAGNRQFVVADPDGYLLRFFSDLGRRAIVG